MLFSSLEFLFLFLPLTLAIYFFSPLRWRNVVLLVSSLVFYGFGEPVYLFLMIFVVVMDYLFGAWIVRARRKGRKTGRILALAVCLNLAILIFFKYYDLLAETVGISPLGLSLPIGISFYIFQALSYVIDVDRQEAEAARNLVDFGAYVTLFPQLIAGPIVRYSQIDRELRERRHTVERCAEGVAIFCAGLSKKVLLANPAGELQLHLASRGESGTVLGTWLSLLLFAAQIYFDFSGYSDMAIGLGRILGFDFPENFRYPYISRSITEFWRRWHMTLSLWFREYVYIPLGGNRRGRWRTLRNLLITWTLTGLWHGASWNFLLWGLYFFFLLSLEKFVLGRFLSKLPACLGHAYALFFILVGWLIFASDGESAIGGASFALRLVGGGGAALSDGWILYELRRNLLFLIILAVGSTPLPKQIFTRVFEKRQTVGRLLRGVLCLLSLVFSTAYLVDSGYNPFLYFRF